MGYPGKLTNLSALLAKLETTYGVGATLAATTDGHLLALSDRYPGIFSAEYVYDGATGPAPGNLGMLRRVGAVGRSATGTIPMRAKGAGTTYTSTVLPNIHTMLKASGFDATLATGTYTYTPTVDSLVYSSMALEAYKRGEKWKIIGALASCGFEITGPQVPLWQFETKGILSDAVVDAAMVAPTYPTLTMAEPLAKGLSLTIGAYTAVGVKSGSFKMNRVLEPRMDLTVADAFAGYVPGGYDPNPASPWNRQRSRARQRLADSTPTRCESSGRSWRYRSAAVRPHTTGGS